MYIPFHLNEGFCFVVIYFSLYGIQRSRAELQFTDWDFWESNITSSYLHQIDLDSFFFFSPKDWLGATKITNVPFGTPLTRHVSVCVNVTKGDSVAADCPGSESVPLLVCILSAEEKHKKITHKPINNLCYVLGTLLCSCLHIFPSLLLNESMVKKKLQMSHMKLNQVPSHPSLIAWCKI